MLGQLDKWSRRAVLGMLALMPIVLYGASQMRIGSASVHEWLPGGREERQRYERFLEEFGTDQFVLISWDGCKLDDPRLEQFQLQVEKQPPHSKPLLQAVTATPQVLRTLIDPPLNLPPRQAARRLRGTLLGHDGICALVAKVSTHGLANQTETIEHIYRAADAVDGLGRDQLRLAGSIYEAYSIDVASERSMRQLAIPSMLLGIALSFVCLRSVWSAMAVLIIAGVGTLLAIATVTFTGGEFSAVLIVLPTLIFMLTLSSAVHLMHYYADAAAAYTAHVGSRAMLMGFKPSILASLTTALGMASLTASHLEPIRQFGLYSSITLCVAAVFLLVSFPALSDWFCSCSVALRSPSITSGASSSPALSAATRAEPTEEPVAQSTTELLEQAKESIRSDTHAAVTSPLAARYTAWINKHAILVSLLGFWLIALSLFGLTFLQPSTRFDDMFPRESPTLRDMQWLEQNLGPIASVEVLLNFPSDSTLSTYERIEWVDQVCQSIRNDDQLGYALSATTFLPDLPQTGSLRDVARRAVLRTKLDQSLPALREGGWMVDTPQGQVWRVTAKVSTTVEGDYGSLTERVFNSAVNCTRVSAKDSAKNSYPNRRPSPTTDDPPLQVAPLRAATIDSLPFEVEISGLYPIMHKTQLALMDDLQISFTAAFVLITPVMMLIARGFWAGLLIMVPNVLPETLVFGAMAWLGFQLDIAGLLTASVAMGIAVNDTMHFVNWYARRLASGDTRIEAIGDTLTCCAAAMFHTMLISCCSMLPFLFADFMPTRQFALLMIAMLSSAILGDLVLLPALLLSPLGRCLLPRGRPLDPLKGTA